jgi:hypothetical protein
MVSVLVCGLMVLLLVDGRRFLQISDIHIDPFYIPNSSVSRSCHAGSNEGGTPHSYGIYICDTAPSLFYSTVEFISSIENLDFVLITGDISRHDNDKKIPISMQETVWAHEVISGAFRTTLPSVPVLFTLGNNDVFPRQLFSYKESKDLLNQIADIWAPYLNDNYFMIPELLEDSMLKKPALETFRKYGYYVKEVSRSLFVVSLNTLVFFRRNSLVTECHIKDSDGDRHIKWLYDVLHDIVKIEKRTGLKQNVIIIGHIIPSYDLYKESCFEQYRNFMHQYSSQIVGQFFGHSDLDYFRTVHTDVGRPFGTFFTSGSLVPTLDPTVRIFDFNPSSLNTNSDPFLLNYHQLATDLEKNTREKKVSFREVYSFKGIFPKYSLSPKDLFRLRADFYSDFNLWQSFLQISFRKNERYIRRIKALNVCVGVLGNEKDLLCNLRQAFCDGDDHKYQIGGDTFECQDLFDMSTFLKRKRILFQK